MKAFVWRVQYKSIAFITILLLVQAIAKEEERDKSDKSFKSSALHPYQLLQSSDQPTFEWVLKKEKKFTSFLSLSELPQKVDFSSEFAVLKDQQWLGSCTAQVITLALEYILKKQDINENLSPLYVYYNERKLTNSLDKDSGASLSDAIMAVRKYGVCREQTWPYEEIDTQYKVKPSKKAYKEGKKVFKHHKLVHTNLPYDLRIIKSFLAKKPLFYVG